MMYISWLKLINMIQKYIPGNWKGVEWDFRNEDTPPSGYIRYLIQVKYIRNDHLNLRLSYSIGVSLSRNLAVELFVCPSNKKL